jgi:hypothetical protein
MQRLGLVVKQLQDLIPLAGVGTDLGKAVLKALSDLAKHVPSGASSPAAEKNNIESMAMRNAQQGMASRQMAEQRAQQMKGGGAQQAAAAA